MRRALFPEAQAEPSSDPQSYVVILPRDYRLAPSGCVVWLPVRLRGWDKAQHETPSLLEVDSALCQEDLEVEALRAQGVDVGPDKIGPLCVWMGYQIWIGPTCALELADGAYVGGYESPEGWLVAPWKRTATMAPGEPRFTVLPHEALHARRRRLGLNPCFHAGSCTALEESL